MTKGMTLIELVVTIGIVSLLLVAGIPSYNHFKDVNNLNQAADDVRSAILDTQSFAMSPEQSKVTIYDGYSIEFFADTSDYKIYQYNSDNPDNKNLVKSSSLVGVNFKSSPTIQFPIAKQGKMDCSNLVKITVHSSKLDTDKIIQVNCATGQMTIP
jgi:prepilin-type N-terminal cleavage/methylation domain-containing protein